MLNCYYFNMNSNSMQKALTKNSISTASFSEKLAAQNSTCQHSLIDNHQGLTCTFGHPVIDETTMSIRSNKSNQKSEARSRHQTSRHNIDMRYEYPQTTKSSHQQLQMILKSQNINLKQQNQLLLHEVYRLKAGNKKYKQACQIKRLELQQIRQQSQAQKKRGDDIMNTMMAKLLILEQKMHEKQLNQSSCSLLDILKQAEERME